MSIAVNVVNVNGYLLTSVSYKFSSSFSVKRNLNVNFTLLTFIPVILMASPIFFFILFSFYAFRDSVPYNYSEQRFRQGWRGNWRYDMQVPLFRISLNQSGQNPSGSAVRMTIVLFIWYVLLLSESLGHPWGQFFIGPSIGNSHSSGWPSVSVQLSNFFLSSCMSFFTHRALPVGSEILAYWQHPFLSFQNRLIEVFNRNFPGPIFSCHLSLFQVTTWNHREYSFTQFGTSEHSTWAAWRQTCSIFPHSLHTGPYFLLHLASFLAHTYNQQLMDLQLLNYYFF